jgi:hypothetical protein
MSGTTSIFNVPVDGGRLADLGNPLLCAPPAIKGILHSLTADSFSAVLIEPSTDKSTTVVVVVLAVAVVVLGF